MRTVWESESIAGVKVLSRGRFPFGSAGMSYSALLAVSAGERRSFHDDISIVVIRLNTRS